MELKSYLLDRKRVVDRALERFAPGTEGLAGEVARAMNYSLFAGGKRLRPILCIAGSEAVGGGRDGVLSVACALELIHTYSLIHDDLPAMDNDDLRRGKPTNHKVYGEAVALLAGDGLLTEAFVLMTRAEASGTDPRLLLKVIALIGRAAGYEGMVGGQLVDIRYEGAQVNPSVVEFLHSRKTGALISASVTAGAILGGGTEEQVKAITSYGEAVGLAFQIADDILDIEGDPDKTGKNTGGDAKKKKITYPSVLGLSESKRIQNSVVREALGAIGRFDEKADPLRLLASYIIERQQ
ncbi:MAG: polyprenyl synthetase family protein [Desulfobacteraceae bacterium]|nr:MAG: polyprenyl synthetase family protein [Desulfobacteraceae bacterium]